MSDIFVKFSYGCKNMVFGIIPPNSCLLIKSVDIFGSLQPETGRLASRSLFVEISELNPEKMHLIHAF